MELYVCASQLVDCRMTVISWEDLIREKSFLNIPSAVAIGVFDGMHLGHKAIMKELVAFQAEASVVITFRENPQLCLTGKSPGSLTTPRQRYELFRKQKVTHLVLIDFSKEFGRLTGQEFISAIQESIFVKTLIVGSDFRCGHSRDTDVIAIREMLSSSGVLVKGIDHVVLKGESISSTRIRKCVHLGEFQSINKMLGNAYEIDLGKYFDSSSEGNYFFKSNRLEQILPKFGRYEVIAIDRNSTEVAAVIEISGPDIKLWLKDKLNSQLERIRFIDRIQTFRY